MPHSVNNGEDASFMPFKSFKALKKYIHVYCRSFLDNDDELFDKSKIQEI